MSEPHCATDGCLALDYIERIAELERINLDYAVHEKKLEATIAELRETLEKNSLKRVEADGVGDNNGFFELEEKVDE